VIRDFKGGKAVVGGAEAKDTISCSAPFGHQDGAAEDHLPSFRRQGSALAQASLYEGPAIPTHHLKAFNRSLKFWSNRNFRVGFKGSFSLLMEQ